jgi:hypothetical protein
VTAEERLQALAPLGFTPRQTQFLATVALHSGYCLRRQYASFASVAYGKNVRNFLDVLVERRLATRFTYRADRGHLYHLQARPIYRALGQEDDRNRRHTSAAHVARKLMLLDVVLSDPQTHWMATEAEKVALFTDTWRVPLGDLPRGASVPEGERTLGPTTRYFGHKLPIGVADNPPRAHFVYLATDPGTQPFERFLRDHARLLRALPEWTVMVVHGSQIAATPLWEATFRRVVDSTIRLQGEAAQALGRFLIARRAVERKDFAALSVADLTAFRAAKVRFAEPAIEALFGTWLASGQDAIDPSLLLSVLPRPGQLVVRTLPYTYTQFGSFAGIL